MLKVVAGSAAAAAAAAAFYFQKFSSSFCFFFCFFKGRDFWLWKILEINFFSFERVILGKFEFCIVFFYFFEGKKVFTL